MQAVGFRAVAAPHRPALTPLTNLPPSEAGLNGAMETRSSPSLETLHRLADAAGIRKRSTGCGTRGTRGAGRALGKTELYRKLKATHDFARLQRLSRRDEARKRFEAAGKRRAQVTYYQRDPIMLDALGEHQFVFYRPGNKSSVTYNVESLVDYLLCSGVFRDPVSQLPFSEDDLKRLDAQASAAGLNKASTLVASANSSQYSDERVRRDGLLALDRCAGEYVAEMLSLIENCEDPEDGEMHLAMHLFPSFSDIFDKMRQADREFSSHALKHYVETILGPPNRPTYITDQADLLGIIVLFLKQCASV